MNRELKHFGKHSMTEKEIKTQEKIERLIPVGFKLKDGVTWYNTIHRFLWHPQKGDLFYDPSNKIIFQYKEWKSMLDGCFFSMDGFARIAEYKKHAKSFWCSNLAVRKCFPIQRA